MKKRQTLATLLALALVAAPVGVFAQNKYALSVTQTEIMIGQTIAYSGPTGVYSSIPKSDVDFFKMINERGGINSRKISLVSIGSRWHSVGKLVSAK
jgi:branched-chain amino acid transport system substrate-binding protein